MNTYDLAFQQQRQSLYTAQVADTQYHEYDLFPRLKGKKNIHEHYLVFPLERSENQSGTMRRWTTSRIGFTYMLVLNLTKA